LAKFVIPVKTGIQSFQHVLDSRLRGNDSVGAFFKGLTDETPVVVTFLKDSSKDFRPPQNAKFKDLTPERD